jgi:hypothetical protein
MKASVWLSLAMIEESMSTNVLGRTLTEQFG